LLLAVILVILVPNVKPYLLPLKEVDCDYAGTLYFLKIKIVCDFVLEMKYKV
jgi:hypothetical protein